MPAQLRSRTRAPENSMFSTVRSLPTTTQIPLPPASLPLARIFARSPPTPRMVRWLARIVTHHLRAHRPRFRWYRHPWQPGWPAMAWRTARAARPSTSRPERRRSDRRKDSRKTARDDPAIHLDDAFANSGLLLGARSRVGGASDHPSAVLHVGLLCECGRGQLRADQPRAGQGRQFVVCADPGPRRGRGQRSRRLTRHSNSRRTSSIRGYTGYRPLGVGQSISNFAGNSPAVNVFCTQVTMSSHTALCRYLAISLSSPYICSNDSLRLPNR